MNRHERRQSTFYTQYVSQLPRIPIDAPHERDRVYQRKQRRAKIEIAPTLHAALRELAAAEDISVGLLVTLLINRGLDHHGGRT